MRSELQRAALAAVILMLAGCTPDAPQALGTLEWDRVTLPSPVAERIVRIDVREGQQVAAGTPLLQLELTRTQSQLAATQAQATQSREALAELSARFLLGQEPFAPGDSAKRYADFDQLMRRDEWFGRGEEGA